MRTSIRAALCAALFLVAGCGGQPENTQPVESAVDKGQTGKPWFDEVAAAAKGGGLDPCKLPVAFDVAEDWKPKTVTLTGDIWDDLAKQGDATVTCEIDAKPAGNIGFLRVWSVPAATEPRVALEAFVAADRAAEKDGLTELEYRETTAGALPGVEVTFVRKTELTPEGKRERSLAVAAEGGVVILSLSGLDDEEFEEMLPAYVLAKSTLAKA